MWATKAESRLCSAGALLGSGILLLSQKQCHISKPDPYASRVSCSHACTIVSLTCSRSAVLSVEAPGAGEWLPAGVHSLRQSLARQ